MFRDDDHLYVAIGVTIVFILTILSTVFEWAWVDDDSTLETILAIIKWQGVILPITIVGIAGFEVSRVLATRVIARFKNEDREKGRAEERARIMKDIESLPPAVQEQVRPLIEEKKPG